MKKILVVGEMNKLMANINQILSVDFSVQVCALDSELMTGMMNIVKPDLIIFCFVGVYDVRKDLFIAAAKADSTVPVLVLEREEVDELYEMYYQQEQFEAVICPVKKTDLLAKCCEKLGEKRAELPQEEEIELSGYIYDEEPEITKKHILVVDDSPLLLRNIKGMLEPEYKVSVANSGEQALRFIPKKNPDLILLDYEMPGMDGKETFEKIKEDELGKDIPVVFLTGVAQKQQVYAVLKHEPAGYVLKPPAIEKLLSVVEEALRTSGK